MDVEHLRLLPFAPILAQLRFLFIKLEETGPAGEGGGFVSQRHRRCECVCECVGGSAGMFATFLTR